MRDDLYDDADPLRPARGCYNGGLISIVLWLLIACGILVSL